MKTLHLICCSFILTACGTDTENLFGRGAEPDDAGAEATADAAPSGDATSNDAAPSDASDADAFSGGRAGSGGRSGTGGVPAPSSGGKPPVSDSGGSPSTSSGGAPACTPVVHETGLGQTWVDCVPRATYTVAQATRACETWCKTKSCTVPCRSLTACDVPVVAGETEGTMTGWGTGEGRGLVYQINPVLLSKCGALGAWN